jgi:hypothetical protein
VVKRILRWLWAALPPISMAITAGGLSWKWFIGDRLPAEEVAARVAPAQQAAEAAQSDSFHAASLVDEHAEELKAVWAEVVVLHATQKVYRMFGSKPAERRNELIEDAVGWYSQRYEELLEKDPTKPAEAAQRALKQTWRPDR